MEEIDIIICKKEKKQKLKQCQKNYCEAKKSQFSHQWNSFLIVYAIV